MSTKRWEWLEGLRPQTPVELAISQMAKILLEELSGWPPDITWTDSAAEGRYAPLFAAGAARPARVALEEAITRVGWDLARDEQALEHYRRNNLLERACPESYDRLASAFIETYLSEALFELIERTENRVKRRDAISCLEQLSALLKVEGGP